MRVSISDLHGFNMRRMPDRVYGIKLDNIFIGRKKIQVNSPRHGHGVVEGKNMRESNGGGVKQPLQVQRGNTIHVVNPRATSNPWFTRRKN